MLSLCVTSKTFLRLSNLCDTSPITLIAKGNFPTKNLQILRTRKFAHLTNLRKETFLFKFFPSLHCSFFTFVKKQQCRFSIILIHKGSYTQKNQLFNNCGKKKKKEKEKEKKKLVKFLYKNCFEKLFTQK